MATGEIACTSCGFRNPSHVRFCASCGRLLRRPEVQAKGRTVHRTEPRPAAPTRLGSLTSHLLFLLAGLAIGYLLAQWVDLGSLF